FTGAARRWIVRLSRWGSPRLFNLREEPCEQAGKRQERTELIYSLGADAVGKPAQDRRGDVAKTEIEPIEEAADEAVAVRHEFHGVDEDGGKGAGHDQIDGDRQHARPEEIRIGQQKREGEGPENRNPDDAIAADPVADDTADQCTNG